MRVTNKMIMNNASSNINSAKECVNTRNKQMTSQKKIDRPSDDPVVAVRSLRLSTTLSQVTQYYSKNIPDATSWLDVTETSLINIRSLMTDCRSLAVKGSTDTYNAEDRNTMITQLESLQKQVFAEGNADYAKRTVFTGYRTNSNLVFTEDETETKYRINQTLTAETNMEEHRYYDGVNKVPTTADEVKNPFLGLDPTDANYTFIDDMEQTNYYRMRLNYGLTDNADSINKMTIKDGKGNQIAEFSYFDTTTGLTEDETDVVVNDNSVQHIDGGINLFVFANETDWSNAEITDSTNSSTILSAKGTKTVPDDAIIIIKETGDIILGKNVAATLKNNNATIDIQYDKTGFKEGELRPEYYYNCQKRYDPNDVDTNIPYTKFDENGKRIYFDIEYTVAANQTITINTEACDVFTSDIQRDLAEMIDAVKRTIDAHNKLDEITKMKGESQYASDEYQEYLTTWYDALKKEADYFEDNLQKLFSTELGKIDKYYATISLGITDLGCKKDSLKLTEKRVGDQRETVQGLQSTNDDLDLSQIIIDYTAAYTAYQASLTAAGKLGESTLLNYL
ncbi:flagellin N-terminal helical domain-containing protein [Pseudobutyrivibrio xylanivorans]|uniref:Flagellar hook-associated protein 3 FlgL n=1 Tax=Pseudobutyrivibrio xylanivorans TaxID=185007 RepID=A0A1G5RYD7_PSEXY|nr:flagellar hook-associated protein 3 [Pseudobutyrivibrio xylanivorans]SCZ78770.1 flagellar hook-associated protein 3 FlgL [Pseudobutyrivibrio xylanivorans]